VPNSNRQKFNITSDRDPLTGAYDAACRFTREHYQKRLGCELQDFFPTILSRVVNGEVVGVCGLRNAADGALHLEQYLDMPVEALVAGGCRENIVELGGFAASCQLEAFLLMQFMAETLKNMGFRHVVCTANRPIRGCLRRLGIRFQQLAEADPSRLRDPTDSWGSYYKTSPLVLTGEVEAGVEAIRGLVKTAA
jgi:hypothetical protein